MFIHKFYAFIFDFIVILLDLKQKKTNVYSICSRHIKYKIKIAVKNVIFNSKIQNYKFLLI